MFFRAFAEKRLLRLLQRSQVHGQGCDFLRGGIVNLSRYPTLLLLLNAQHPGGHLTQGLLSQFLLPDVFNHRHAVLKLTIVVAHRRHRTLSHLYTPHAR
jgi:hypothetical protein